MTNIGQHPGQLLTNVFLQYILGPRAAHPSLEPLLLISSLLSSTGTLLRQGNMAEMGNLPW